MFLRENYFCDFGKKTKFCDSNINFDFTVLMRELFWKNMVLVKKFDLRFWRKKNHFLK